MAWSHATARVSTHRVHAEPPSSSASSRSPPSTRADRPRPPPSPTVPSLAAPTTSPSPSASPSPSPSFPSSPPSSSTREAKDPAAFADMDAARAYIQSQSVWKVGISQTLNALSASAFGATSSSLGGRLYRFLTSLAPSTKVRARANDSEGGLSSVRLLGPRTDDEVRIDIYIYT